MSGIIPDEIRKKLDQVYIHIENASNSNNEVHISSELNKLKTLLEYIQKILISHEPAILIPIPLNKLAQSFNGNLAC